MAEIGRNNNPGLLWIALTQSLLQPTVWFELAKGYGAEKLSWQAGYAARQAVRVDRGILPRVEALHLVGWQNEEIPPPLLGNGDVSETAGQIGRFRQQVTIYPGDWLTWLYLARLQEVAEGEAAAVHSLDRACSLEPIVGETLHFMGLWRLKGGNAPGAIAAFSRLLDIRPIRFGSMMYLGDALLRVGHEVAAEKAFARASLSENPVFLQTLAVRVYEHNYWQEAIELLEKALQIRPDTVPVLLKLAQIQADVYCLHDCRTTLSRLTALAPDNNEVRLLAARVRGLMGDAGEYLELMQQMYDTGGDPLSRLASSLAMTLLYQDDLTAEEVADRHRRLCAPITTAVEQKSTFTNVRSLERRLRIGYVTGDLHRQHPVNVFMLPVLLRHSHTDFEYFIYHTGTMCDGYTRQAMECADHWLEAAGMDDRALQSQIVADQIDILVDLAGHTSSHRLGVFALRAAPVQATFLGYPHSTGLSTIDWLIGDRVVSPPEQAHLFSEGLALMPDSVFCWASVDEYPLPPPRSIGEPVVFGSFNNAMKMSRRTINLWARVLHAVPGSQLLLKAPSLRDEAVQARFAALFAEQGITGDRLILRGPTGLADMMSEYGDMDIALDPTPYNGGTTTLQALWMGIPVVTLKGNNFVGRMGTSFLTSLGESEWVASTEDEYVAVAVRLASRYGTLRQDRPKLRVRMAASPLCEIESYVRHFEALLAGMWRGYCADDRSRLLQVPLPGGVV